MTPVLAWNGERIASREQTFRTGAGPNAGRVKKMRRGEEGKKEEGGSGGLHERTFKGNRDELVRYGAIENKGDGMKGTWVMITVRERRKRGCAGTHDQGAWRRARRRAWCRGC